MRFAFLKHCVVPLRTRGTWSKGRKEFKTPHNRYDPASFLVEYSDGALTVVSGSKSGGGECLNKFLACSRPRLKKRVVVSALAKN